MSFADGKVLLCCLYERTSKNGNRYLTGRLGSAKVIAFLNTEAELQFGATGCFDVYVQGGGEGKADGDAEESRGRKRRQAVAHTNSSGTDTPRPWGVQRWERPSEPKPDPRRPFHYDDISDIGRDR